MKQIKNKMSLYKFKFIFLQCWLTYNQKATYKVTKSNTFTLKQFAYKYNKGKKNKEQK